MFNKLLPIGIDEIIAILVFIVASLLLVLPFFQTVQALAAGYIIICVVFRKYEATQLKLRRHTSLKDQK